MGFVFLIIFTIISLFFAVSYVNHRVQLSKEDMMVRPIGTPVEVNGSMMNVYTEGTGNKTLVFLSGGGTCSPVLDFKSLYSQLSDTYRVAVVEKAGYGFSEITKSSRDIDTILSETRQALALAGVYAPYVLCPHSMSGIEALYWAQKYPDEALAIIGLDMSVPQAYENYKINMTVIKLCAFAVNTGITRWFPGLVESDAVKHGALSEEEKEIYMAVFYRRMVTGNMLNEITKIKTNAQYVASGGIPDIPILMFASNGTGTGWEETEWRGFQSEFINYTQNGTLVELGCSHYIHNIENKAIAYSIDHWLQDFE